MYGGIGLVFLIRILLLILNSLFGGSGGTPILLP